MLRTLIASFCLLFMTGQASSAQSTDPFALLFGDEDTGIDTGQVEAPGQDDIAIVRIRLRDFTLIETQTAYEARGGLCLPAQALFEALEAPIETTSSGAQGWFITPERTLAIDITSAEAEVGSTLVNLTPQHTEEGWCLPLSEWSEVLPIDFEYQPGTLAIVLTPREILPLEARLERAALRQQIQSNYPIVPDYPELVLPYAWLSFPTADIDLDLQVGADGQMQAQSAMLLAGDVLKMTGQAHYSGTGRPRITLGRLSEAADQLGALKARSFSIGDVVSAPIPLLQESGTGQGFVVSNRPTVSADVFDVTDIRGPLPQGWEAELYDGAQLLGFVTGADINGDYVFSDIALRPGYNRFTVKLFGPYGERDERVVRIMVGADLCPENELQYSFGLIRREAPESYETEPHPSAYASLRYGLSETTSVQFDTVIAQAEAPSGFGASLSGTVLGTYGVVRLASDGMGEPAIALSTQTRLNERGARLLVDVRDFGALETDISGFGADRLQRVTSMAYDTPIELGFGLDPSALQTRLAWTGRQDGSENFTASVRLSGAFGATRWKKALRYTDQDLKTGEPFANFFGDVLVSRSFQDWRLRGAATYTAGNRLDFKTLSLAAQRRFGRRDFGQLALSHDMETSGYALTASYSRAFETFSLSANGGFDAEGGAQVGLRLAFSLFRDGSYGGYALAKPGLSRSGGIRAFVYDDIDDDGGFGPQDLAISNAGFILDQSLRRDQTDVNGVALLAEVQPGHKANLELKQSSIEDPFLRPAQPGLSITPRPGRIIDVAFPLTATADIDGTVLMQKGEYETPIAGVTVEAVSATGEVLAAACTEYDGYFYIDGIPARDVTLKVSEADLNAVGAKAEPLPVSLSREAPSVMGLNLFIIQP